MAMREATPEEIAALFGDNAPAPKQGGMREATPEEIQALMGDEQPAVKPGDVAARRAQMDAQASGEKPNVARERTTIGGEILGGLGELGSSIGNLFNKEAYQGPIANPITGAAIGAVRTAAAPLSPVSSAASSLGEDLSQAAQKAGFSTAADVIGAVGQSAADVLAPMGISRYARTAAQGIKATPALNDAIFASRRMKGAAASAELAGAEKSAAGKLAAIEADIAEGKQGIHQLREATKDSIPSASEIKARFAPKAELGADVGKGVKDTINTAWDASKERFNKIYGGLTDVGADMPATPSSYAAAGGELQGARGVTGLPSTRPEGIAAKIKKTVDISKMEDDTYTALKTQLDSVPAWDKPRVQGVIDEFVKANGLPANPAEISVRDLILERQRLRAGIRATRDDNAKRQFKELIGGLEDDIAMADRDVAKNLFTADKLYATEHAPYFSKGTVTRAIAEGNPEAVVDAIYRPTASAGGRVGPQSKAIEAMTRARELIKDLKQWDRVNQAFMNKGLEAATASGEFKASDLTKWWAKYKDPANTNSSVLRKGLGERQFNEIDGVMKQLGSVKPKGLDDIAKTLTKQLEASGKVQSETVRAAQAATRKRLEGEIAKFTGTPVDRIARRFESIGTGVVTTATISGALGSSSALARGVVGGLIILSAKGAAKLLSSVQGRNLFKAMARGAPGTAQASATARQIENLLNKGEEE